MGRHRRKVTEEFGAGVDEETQQTIEDRLGNTAMICQSCNARNPTDADKCRKCGHTNLRRKASDFRGKGTEGQ